MRPGVLMLVRCTWARVSSDWPCNVATHAQVKLIGALSLVTPYSCVHYLHATSYLCLLQLYFLYSTRSSYSLVITVAILFLSSHIITSNSHIYNLLPILITRLLLLFCV